MTVLFGKSNLERKGVAMLDISKFSTAFLTQRLSEKNMDEIYEFCLTNPQYYDYCGAALEKRMIARDLTLLPEGKGMEDKYYVGLYDSDGLVAVLDVVDGFPDASTVFIGFFMINGTKSNKGIGSAVINALCAYLKSEGRSSVRLAYVKENPQAAHFWTKNMFCPIFEVNDERGHLVVGERAL